MTNANDMKVERGALISPQVDYLEALALWVKESDCGMAKIIAEVCGHRLNYTYRYYDAVEGPDMRHFPMDKFHLVVKQSGDTRMLDWIEAQVGRVAVRLPLPGTAQGLHAGAMALKEVSEAVDMWVRCIEDGVLTARERVLIACECREALAALVAILAVCERHEGIR